VLCRLIVHIEPIRTTVPNLVYAASGNEVMTVRVAGVVLVRDGKVLTTHTVYER